MNKGFYKIGRKVWCFIYSRSEPDIYIPMRGEIVEVLTDPITPQYCVKPIKFVDSIDFLKKFMLKNQYFLLDIGNESVRSRPLTLGNDNFANSKSELVKVINDMDRKFVIEEQLIFSNYDEMIFYFSKLQDHLIEKEINKLKERMTQKPYINGIYKVKNRKDFNNRFDQGFGDMVRKKYKTEGQIDYYYRLL